MEEQKRDFWPSLAQVFAVMGATIAGLIGIIYPLVDDTPIAYDRIFEGIVLFVVGATLHFGPRIWRQAVRR